MDNDGVSPEENSDDAIARLIALTERKHELWDKLGNCQDDELRTQLFDELAANREELARLKDIVSHQLDEPHTPSPPVGQKPEPPRSVGERLRSSLLIPSEGVAPATPPSPPLSENPSEMEGLQSAEKATGDSVVSDRADAKSADPEPVETPPEATRPITTDASPSSPEDTPSTSREDEMVALHSSRQSEVAASSDPGSEAEASGGLDERRTYAHQAYQDLERVRPGHSPGRSNPLPIFAILVAIGAVALVAWLLFLRPGGSTETIEATTTTTASVDAEASAVDQIRAVLDGLGYGSVMIEERAGTIYLGGIVGADSDRTATIGASQALTRGMPLDASALMIAAEDEIASPEVDEGTQQPVIASPVVDGPYVEATLDGKDFVLAGVVPSAELASSYLQAAEIAYAPYVRSELMVDEQLETPDWLSRGPGAIVMLPMITEGRILIADDQVQMSGQSPNQAGIDRLQGALGQITGLSVVVGDVEITNLQPPSWVIAADVGVVELSGEVPTEEIRDLLVEGAAAAYGPDNVQNRMTVNPNVYPSLWMYSGGPLLQAMSTFPDYELRIDGTAFSGFINGNVTFESGSATFSGNYAQVLDVGVSVLTRDPSLRLVIEGHTDDRGSDASNLALSQLRAEAVRDYFVGGGIDASRLTAIGIGEAQPVVPNDSAAGRARNRRIQYILTTSR